MNNDAFVKNVASRLIEQIRNGTAPWQKPWRPGTSFLPFNPTNGTRYKGINVVNLLSRGYGDARWMTYHQAQIRGYQVRRGEKGTQVQYWRFDEERKIKDSNGRPIIDANGEPRTEKVRLEQEKTLAVKAVKHWLSSHQGWLLILDNVILDNADELRMVSAFLPSGKNGHVLLTIQAHAVGAIAPGVDIQEMEIDEAACFLLR